MRDLGVNRLFARSMLRVQRARTPTFSGKNLDPGFGMIHLATIRVPSSTAFALLK